MDLLFNSIGIMGMLCFLSGYFLLQLGRVAGNSYPFLLLNLAGAVLVMISLLWDWNLPAFLLETAWAVISIYGIIRRMLRSPHNPSRRSLL